MKCFKINAFEVISRAIEEGVEAGWFNSLKYEENPPASEVKEKIIQAVTDAICNVVIFDEDN